MESESDWSRSPNSCTGPRDVPPNIQHQGVDFMWQNGPPPYFPRPAQSHSQTQSEFPWKPMHQPSYNPNTPTKFYANSGPQFEVPGKHSHDRSNCLSKKRTNAARRVWSASEEECLLIGLKECVANGMKGDNGFKMGHLGALEQHMNKHFPGTDLKGDPHIKSKIHVWISTLCTMLGMSGFGWDDHACQIVVDDYVWDAYVKIDTAAKGMRKKSYPLFNEWATVFGKDRATGEYRTTITEALNDLCASDKRKSPTSPAMGTSKAGDSPTAPTQSDADSSAKPRARCETVTSPSKTEKPQNKRPKKHDGDTVHVVNLMGKFFGEISSHMGEIKQNLGTEREAIEMRRKVIDAIRPIQNLSFKDKLTVTGRICEKATDVDMLLRLDDEERTLMATMIKDKEY